MSIQRDDFQIIEDRIRGKVLEKYVGPGGNVVVPEDVTIIGSSAFEGCETLTSIIFGEEVASIRWNAFKNCTSLERIEIPPKEEYIDDGVFDGCTILKDIVFHKNIRRIGSSFKKCVSLKRIIIPRNVYSLSPDAFEDCDDNLEIQFESRETKIFGKKFNGWNATKFCIPVIKTVIPSQLETTEVKKGILPVAAKYILNEEVTEEYKNAWLKYLKSQRKSLLETINENPVLKKLALEEKIITENDLSIEPEAQDVFLSMTLKEARTVFVVSKRSTGYSINSLKSDIAYETANGVFFSRKVTDKIICVPDEIGGLPVVHFAARSIPSDAIVLCNPKMFNSLSRETRINTAVRYLKNEEIFPDIQKEAIESFIKKYQEDIAIVLSDSTEAPMYVRFMELAKPKSEILEKLIERTHGVSEITAVLLQYKQGKEKNTNVIADELSLDTVSKKMTVAELKKSWTYTTYKDRETGKGYAVITNYKGKEENIVVPAMIGKSIVNEIRMSFPSFTKSVTFESNEIDYQSTMKDCKEMANKDGFIIVHIGSRVILSDYIGPKDIRTIVIPEGVTENTYGTFCKCKIREAIFPEGFQTIAGGTFSDCLGLQCVQLPESLRTIEQGAFDGCVALKKIYIPAGVEKLGILSTGGQYINTIYGEKGSKAEEYAAKYKINFIERRPDTIPMPDYIISDGTLVKYVGEELNIIIPEEVTSIAGQAFEMRKELLKTVKLSENVKVLHSFAFSDCINLEEVDFPAGIIEIESYAFSSCGNLKQVKLPEGLIKIHENAFMWCSNLTDVRISEGTISIGEKAFSGCRKLQKVWLPASVQEIGEDAFSNGYADVHLIEIYAPAGSCAQKYAMENNIKWVET